MAIFEKRAGAPSGTITITLDNGTYSVGDGGTFTVTDPGSINSLRTHPFVQLQGGTGGGYAPPPVISDVFLKDGVLTDGRTGLPVTGVGGGGGGTATSGAGAPSTLTNGSTYFQTSGGVVVAEWVGTAGDVPVQVADLSGTPSAAYTAARQAANDTSYAPQVPLLVLPIAAGGSPIPHTPVTMGAPNAYRLSRCVVPKSGKLRDLAVWVGTTGGNHKGLVYDTAATRNKLYEGASVAVGAGTAWQILCDPNIDVVAGQQLDMGVMSDSATPTYGRTSNVANATSGSQLPAAFTLGQAALPKLTSVQTAGSYAGPATIAEATLSITANPLLVIARIS